MKNILFSWFLLLPVFSLLGQDQSGIRYFDLQQVRLLPGPFRQAQDLDKQYILSLDPDRLLAPFLREAGLSPKAEPYPNWENTGLDGHIGGHYVSALALMWAATGDEAIKSRLEYMLGEWKRCQEANGNGYIGGVPGGKAMWEQIAQGQIKAGGFDLNGKWVPLYNIHKTYAGLRDAWMVARQELAREMLINMSDWAIRLVANLSDQQIQEMLRSEHGGLNEIFADVAAITGEEKYLQLARRFSHQAILDPLLDRRDELTGKHANTQIPKVVGYKRIADLEGKESWSEAARFFWETVVENRSVCIGGNSAYEHFHPADDFSKMLESAQGPETCNTYNMLRLTKLLFAGSGEGKYMDYYERAVYNHILSSQHPTTGGLVYFTPMRPGLYRVYSQPQTSFWCCVGSGMENHAKYGEMIYAHSEEALYVNLFMASTLDWKEKNIKVVQQTRFPDEATTTLLVNPAKKTAFVLKLRYPAWVEKGALEIKINGKPHVVSQTPQGYISIERVWKKGDKVLVKMPMKMVAEQMPDHSEYYSFLYGPVVLAARLESDSLQGLFADESRNGHIASGALIPLEELPVLEGKIEDIVSNIQPVKGKLLTFRLNSLAPEKYKVGMELIPFFRLYESRYVVYWPRMISK